MIARLRRLSGSFEEASADLGATPWQTFRLVTLPNLRTALVAGALLAFALSFDEIIVTTFTVGTGDETLPIWIFTNFSRPTQLPIVNAVAVIVILISIIPVYLAHRLTREEATSARGVGAVAGASGRRRSRWSRSFDSGLASRVAGGPWMFVFFSNRLGCAGSSASLRRGDAGVAVGVRRHRARLAPMGRLAIAVRGRRSARRPRSA